MPTLVNFYESDHITKLSFPSISFEQLGSNTSTNKRLWTAFDIEFVTTLMKLHDSIFIGHYDQPHKFGNQFRRFLPRYTAVDMSHFVDKGSFSTLERIVDFLFPDGTKPIYHMADISQSRIEDIASIDDFGVFWHIYFVECCDANYMTEIIQRLGESTEAVCFEPGVNGLYYKDTLQGQSFFASCRYKKKDFLSQACFQELSKKILWSEETIPDFFDSSYIRNLAGSTIERDEKFHTDR